MPARPWPRQAQAVTTRTGTGKGACHRLGRPLPRFLFDVARRTARGRRTATDLPGHGGAQRGCHFASVVPVLPGDRRAPPSRRRGCPFAGPQSRRGGRGRWLRRDCAARPKACLAWLAWQDKRPKDLVTLADEAANLWRNALGHSPFANGYTFGLLSLFTWTAGRSR